MNSYQLKRLLLDIVYPNRCPFCNAAIRYDKYYCASNPKCAFSAGDLSMLQERGLIEPIANITEAFAVFAYDKSTMPFVYRIKDDTCDYVSSAAAKLISERIEDLIPALDLITCVPTDKVKLGQRGCNPPALIALRVSAIIGVPCNVRLLRKTRITKDQKGLSAKQRVENLKGAFAVNLHKGKPLPPTMLLIDDVCTTGATLSETAGVLLAGGAKRVYAAVVASTVKNSMSSDVPCR